MRWKWSLSTGSTGSGYAEQQDEIVLMQKEFIHDVIREEVARAMNDVVCPQVCQAVRHSLLFPTLPHRSDPISPRMTPERSLSFTAVSI
jgi:hypothetical protein